jgi:FtsH-binding integral membrane protein
MDNKLKKFSSLLRQKKDLMGCIFLTLIFQLVVSVITMKLDQDKNLLGNFMKTNKYLPQIGLIISFFAIFYGIFKTKSFLTKQLLFGLLSIIMGFILSSIIHIINDQELVESAVISTIINFGLMFLLGLVIVYFGYDLSWLGILLFVGLFVLIAVQVIGMFSPQSDETHKMIAYASVVIFSLYILYDTNKILLKYQNKSKSDCILGAIDYYLDIINLFEDYLLIGSSK